MSKNSISKSPDRNTFQKNGYLERKAKEGKTPDNDPNVKAMADYYDSWNIKEDEREKDPEWQKENLEWDLRTTDWILEKARANECYAQNIYAALCNNGFIKLDVIPILTEKEWSCSWRYAGGIVAHMLGKGDYIDWYCSGIRNEDLGNGLNGVEPVLDKDGRDYVPEGLITEEIWEDFKKLGWVPAKGGDWEDFED
jgi:hypothetical protein